MPGEVWLGLVLAIIAALGFIGWRLVKLGEARVLAKLREMEGKAREAKAKEGEDWNAGGGLAGAIGRGLQDDSDVDG